MDLNALLYTNEAAAYFRCTTHRINRWRTLGHLDAAGIDKQGRRLYRFGDLLEAERKTRRSPNSRRATCHAH